MQPQQDTLPPERRDVRRRAQHAGVLVPWANSVVETELPQWAGGLVAWHYARLVPPSGATALDEDFLAGLLTAVPAALGQLAALPLERVYLACTSAAFMLPSQAKTAATAAAVPVITAFDAIIAALRQQQADRIVLLTPYPQRVCAAEAVMFGDHGITVTGRAALNLTDGYSAIEPGQIQDLARQVSMRAVEEAQVIVLSCTGWPTLGLENVLTPELGKEVLSSNQAIVTHALRAGGGTR
jgi:maleate isomerase